MKQHIRCIGVQSTISFRNIMDWKDVPISKHWLTNNSNILVVVIVDKKIKLQCKHAFIIITEGRETPFFGQKNIRTGISSNFLIFEMHASIHITLIGDCLKPSLVYDTHVSKSLTHFNRNFLAKFSKSTTKVLISNTGFLLMMNGISFLR